MQSDSLASVLEVGKMSNEVNQTRGTCFRERSGEAREEAVECIKCGDEKHSACPERTHVLFKIGRECLGGPIFGGWVS